MVWENTSDLDELTSGFAPSIKILRPEINARHHHSWITLRSTSDLRS